MVLSFSDFLRKYKEKFEVLWYKYGRNITTQCELTAEHNFAHALYDFYTHTQPDKPEPYLSNAKANALERIAGEVFELFEETRAKQIEMEQKYPVIQRLGMFVVEALYMNTALLHAQYRDKLKKIVYGEKEAKEPDDPAKAVVENLSPDKKEWVKFGGMPLFLPREKEKAVKMLKELLIKIEGE